MRIGRHVGTFEHDRTDVLVSFAELVSGAHYVFSRAANVEVLFFAQNQDPEEFLALFGSDEGRIRCDPDRC